MTQLDGVPSILVNGGELSAIDLVDGVCSVQVEINQESIDSVLLMNETYYFLF
jgi:hypothetical protein